MAQNQPIAPSIARSMRETAESLVVAFILAFVFRAFVVEAFVIPTGSMADTLRGVHFRLTCPHCGHQYNYGFIPQRYPRAGGGYMPEGATPPQPIRIIPPRLHSSPIPICPLCHHKANTAEPKRVTNGDRILVLKYLYQLSEPKRWDVVVFKNPTDPSKNYIKRLIGRPGETVEIIDGDVYINGTIQHKPPHVQQQLWLPIWHNDYQPAQTNQPANERFAILDQPFQPDNHDTAWQIDNTTKQFRFNGSNHPHTLTFHPDQLRWLLSDFIAYNGPPNTHATFLTTDLKIAGCLVPTDQPTTLTFRLSKYGTDYLAEIDTAGHARLIQTTPITPPNNNNNSDSDNDSDSNTNGPTILAEFSFEPITQPTELSFAIVDHRFEITIGENTLTHNGPNDPSDWGYSFRHALFSPTVSITATGGACQWQHAALFRDIHYTRTDGSGQPGLATEGQPLTLEQDQFFVMGDNSSQSHDSRFWEVEGVGNNRAYPRGIVPREYLIGRAFFVYWPGGFHLNPNFRFALIPNVGDMRFIH